MNDDYSHYPPYYSNSSYRDKIRSRRERELDRTDGRFQGLKRGLAEREPMSPDMDHPGSGVRAMEVR